VKNRLVAAADRAIAAYREGGTVYESTWKQARELLANALRLSPDDMVRARLRLVEGHIARINGRSAAELSDAVAKFQEAQRLDPKWPDPQLGLARTYVYGLKDIDKAFQALEQAKARGYELGDREKAQLADGYRERGDRTFRESRKVLGMPQEEDQLRRAKEDYERALDLYQSIASAGNASEQSVRVEKSLDRVKARLDEIDGWPRGLRWVKPLVDIWR
jgi:tetratricopeptide (TPR) repeat protein